MMQSKIISGPPKYFTCDWEAAEKSVRELIKLNPKTASTGHGKPLRGQELKESLEKLKKTFYNKSIPSHGRYIPNPAITDANGVIYIPPKKRNTKETVWEIFGLTALVVFGLVYTGNKRKKRRIVNETLLDIEYNF